MAKVPIFNRLKTKRFTKGKWVPIKVTTATPKQITAMKAIQHPKTRKGGFPSKPEIPRRVDPTSFKNISNFRWT